MVYLYCTFGERRFTIVFQGILILVYFVAGYWAAGQTIYANKIRIGTFKDLVLTRIIVGALLGWVLIPVAIIKKVISK